jgi:hypothetical protein
MLNYTDITQNTYIQSWTVTEIMAIEKYGLLGGPRTIDRLWRHIRPLRMAGNKTSLANTSKGCYTHSVLLSVLPVQFQNGR